MTRSMFRIMRYAGVLVCSVLVPCAPALSQQTARTINEVHSIISLSPSQRPQGTFLARRPGDATFENAPANYHVFSAAAVGEDASVETLQLIFAGETTLTGIKLSNKDFVVEHGGSCYTGNHYSSGQSCTLLVRFKPQGPGHRVGFVQVANSAETNVTTFGLVGNAYVPVISFVPSTITTVPGSVSAGVGTINSSTNMAISGDVLYVADTGNNKLKEMDSSGSLAPTALGPIATPASVAVDSFGIAYTANVHSATYYFSIFYPWGTQTAYGYAYTSSTCTVGAPCAFSAVGMNYPANMSIDAYNNLYFEEGTSGAAEMPVANISGGSGTLNLWHLSDQFSYSSGTPGSFAVDANGNLYTKYSFSSTTCYLLEESLYNAEYSPTANRVAGGVSCGFSGDGGQARSAQISNNIGQMAFDAAGNLYFADSGNQRVRRIDAATGIIRTIAGNGLTGYTGDGSWATHAQLANPTGVAVDSQGQVYILSGSASTGTAQVIRKTTQLGRQLWGATTTGTTSSPLVVVVSNTGNSQMVLTGTSFTLNTADFKIDPLSTTCPLTPGSVLNAGQTCNIGFVFTPTVVGTRYAYYNLQSNTVAGLNQILLSGSGVAPAVAKFVSPISNSAVTANAALTVNIGITSSYKVAPTGTVTLQVDGVTVASGVPVVGGAASISLKSLATGSHTLLAIYSGDKNTAGTRISETVSAR